MKKWKLFLKHNLKQFSIVVVVKLLVMGALFYLGAILIAEVGIKFYMLIGLYTLLVLSFIIEFKETYINIKEKLVEYDDKEVE